MENYHILQNGAQIAVVGGGTTGSFFSIFALKMAKMMEKSVHVTIYEPKDFTMDGPVGCNKCGGIISELQLTEIIYPGRFENAAFPVPLCIYCDRKCKELFRSYACD